MSSSTRIDRSTRRGERSTLAVLGASLACLVVGALVASGAIAAPAKTDTQASSLQSGVDALVRGNEPGVVLLTRKGSRGHSYTAGYGEVATRTPMRADDRFRVASVAKSYTATVVLQLVGEGTLRLTDSVE